jgi:CSLREA domain-containing protein
MKTLSHLFRITLLAALLAATTLSTKPVTQARADSTITVDTDKDDIDPTTGEPNTIDGLCSLREAIANANDDTDPPTYPDCDPGSGNDTIVFAAQIGEIRLSAPLPHITDLDGLTIKGEGHGTVHGDYKYRLFYVEGVPLTIDSLNLFGGFTTGGGAIDNEYGTVTVTNSVFYYNDAWLGGAIYTGGGILTVANSLFLENFTHLGSTPGKGGAVYIISGIEGSPMVTLTNNTFSGNHAAEGGDIYIKSSSAVVNVVNNIFANSGGGGNCVGTGAAVASGSNNLIEDASTTCGLTAANGNLVGYDPLFADPDHGTLSDASPAIGAGADAACAAAPVSNTSYNGLARPQGLHCDIGAYEMPQTPIQARFLSTAAEDGHILESTETSSKGGTLNKTATTLAIGDNAANKQYRAIVSFDTSSLPEDAVITSASLWLRYAGKSGTLPFKTYGNLLVDVKTGAFANDPALHPADFQAPPSKAAVLSFPNPMTLDWNSRYFNPADFQYLNRVGLTQFRLRFKLGDNNDFGADYLKIVSGDGDPYLVPQLIVEYYDR